MDKWEIVTVIIALVGLGVTVGGPIIKLNQIISKLGVTMDHVGSDLKEIKGDLKSQKEHASESHQKIWDHIGENDKTIADHEGRIKVLENSK